MTVGPLPDQEYLQLESGLLVPATHVTSFVRFQSRTYLDVKELGKSINAVYAKNGLRIHPDSGLGMMIARAESLSDSWLLSPVKESIDSALLFDVVRFQHIAHIILRVSEHPRRRQYLKDLTQGPLVGARGTRSIAKDRIWELEMWATFVDAGFAAELRDPPDIVVHLNCGPMGIACKKIYSENNTSKVLSEGVSQITVGNFGFGIVALNIDELHTEAEPFQRNTYKETAAFLNAHCSDFRATHDHHFRRYLTTQRLFCGLISSGGVADLRRHRVRPNQVRQQNAWIAPDSVDSDRAVYLEVLAQFEQGFRRSTPPRR